MSFFFFSAAEQRAARKKVEFRGPRSLPDGTHNQKTSRLALNLLKRAIPFSLRFNLWFVVILFIWSLGKGNGYGAMSLGGVGDAPVRSDGPPPGTGISVRGRERLKPGPGLGRAFWAENGRLWGLQGLRLLII